MKSSGSFDQPILPLGEYPIVAKTGGGRAPASGISASRQKGAKGEAVAIYCQPLVTDDRGASGFPGRVKSGVDMHARKMVVCIPSRNRNVLVNQNIKTEAKCFFDRIFPFIEGIVVGVKCAFC